MSWAGAVCLVTGQFSEFLTMVYRWYWEKVIQARTLGKGKIHNALDIGR